MSTHHDIFNLTLFTRRHPPHPPAGEIQTISDTQYSRRQRRTLCNPSRKKVEAAQGQDVVVEFAFVLRAVPARSICTFTALCPSSAPLLTYPRLVAPTEPARRACSFSEACLARRSRRLHGLLQAGRRAATSTLAPISKTPSTGPAPRRTIRPTRSIRSRQFSSDSPTL